MCSSVVRDKNSTSALTLDAKVDLNCPFLQFITNHLIIMWHFSDAANYQIFPPKK